MKLEFYDFSTRKAEAMGEKLAFVIAAVIAIAMFLSGCGTRPEANPVPSPVATPMATQDVWPTQTPEPSPDQSTNEPKANEAKGYKYLETLGTDSVVSIQGTPYYDFNDHGFSSEGIYHHEDIPFDAYYGLKLDCAQDAVLLYWHDYTGSDVHPVGLTASSPVDDFEQALDTGIWYKDEPYKLNTNIIPNGPYELVTDWSSGESTSIWFYKNGDKNWFCRMDDRDVDYICRWMDRKKQLEKIIQSSGFTPETSLDDTDVIWAYPVPASYDQSKYRCDNQKWRDLADQLVPDKTAPDGQKAAVIHDWIVENLAYDNYKAHVIGVSRANYHQDYTGKYSMWDTHVGVCADFATVYCIMLRHVGVPVVGIDEDDQHVWNIAYIDGRWVEIDLTYDVDRYVDGQDTSDVRTEGTDRYTTFGMPYSEEYLFPSVNRVNYGMFTYKVVTGTGHY